MAMLASPDARPITYPALRACVHAPVPAPPPAAMPERVRVTLVEGDGIGPEVTTAARRVLAAAGARIEWEASRGVHVERLREFDGQPGFTPEPSS